MNYRKRSLSVFLLLVASCNYDKGNTASTLSVEYNKVANKVNLFQRCIKSGKECSEVPIESPRAEEAYIKGCESRDFYACSRLGQYFEFQKTSLDDSLKYYEISCKGGNKYGCEGQYDLAMKLCYLQEQRKYCGKLEPKAEFRIIAFLENLNEKYIDCFVDHNFSYPFNHKRAEALFQERLKGKNKVFLKALQKAKNGKYYDGDGAETLDSYIRVFYGGKFHQDDL